MDWKQWGLGLGGVVLGAGVGGLVAGRTGVEAGGIVAALVAFGVGSQRSDYRTATNVAATAGLSTAVLAWGLSRSGKRHMAGAMERGRQLAAKCCP